MRFRPAVARGALGAFAACCFPTAAGCGEREEPEPGPPRVAETAEAVPELPRGWTVANSRSQGLRLGAPPGWRRGERCLPRGVGTRSATVLCSPDRLVTLSISADRSDESLELAPDQFALRTLAALGERGYRSELKSSEPRRFRARYEGARVDATGVAARTGVRQDLSLVVLRREGVATFTAVIAANAERATGPAVRLAERALRTLRSRPVDAG